MDASAVERIRARIAHVDRLLADNELDHEDLEHRLGALAIELDALPDSDYEEAVRDG
jgi:hypothetical protein